MNRTFKGSLVASAVAVALAAPAAYATNGYFKIGYGTKNRGLAGAGIAYGQDATAPATNPATLSQVGNNIVGGIELFNPNREGQLDATAMNGADSGVEESGATIFAIPHAGASFRMGDITVGLSMTANGGMNTRYNSNIYANAFGPAIPGFAAALGQPVPTFPNTGTLGVNLAQAILAPTVSYKLNDNHAVGASLLLGYQQFRAYGLGLFQGLSSAPGSVTNNGNDHSFGAGVRLGWHGQLTDSFSVGVSASSKIYMDEFEDYEGLFAEQGDFDIPANFGIGLAYHPNDKTTIALDVQRILYGDVDAIANDGPTALQFFSGLQSVLTGGAVGAVARPLGSDNGWGFGWDDITVVKVGVSHRYNEKWTFRGGINHGENPIDDDQNLFNILAPGVVETHATVGFSYHMSPYQEISMAYMHAFREDQSYDYSANLGAPFGVQGYTADIGMDQNALEISYSMNF